MTTNAKSTRRSLATLKLPTKVPALITKAQNIVAAMTNNPAFPSPSPSLPTVTDAINQLQTAETATLSRTKGAVATRNEMRTALLKVLEQLRSQVQAAADADINAAASVIQGAGMAVKATPVRPARVFEAKPGAVSGSANLVAQVPARRASYEWQYSSDGGKTWIVAPTTLRSRITIGGLTPGVTAMFRYRPVTKDGEGDWSQPQSLMVK